MATSRRQVIHVEPYSDGDQRHWPSKPYKPSPEDHYRIVLAQAWAGDLGFPKGIEYYLDKLPDGYALFETPMPTGNQFYKRLFGHVSNRFYDSTKKFLPHFLWLMRGMEGDCECVHCGNYKRSGPVVPRSSRHPLVQTTVERRQPRQAADRDLSESSDPAPNRPAHASSRPQRQRREAGASYAQDPEGNQDIYKEKLKTLEGNRDSNKGIEDDIFEPNSIDWRAEHAWTVPNPQDWAGVDLVQQTLTAIEHQHSFVPRVGELVLFCTNFLHGHYLTLDEEAQEYKFYDFGQKAFHGFPEWRAGVVTEIPSSTAADGPVDFTDIQNSPEKHNNLNTAGFRVETFPDPNNEVDKKDSKQYRYLPLRSIRPLNHWQLLLHGITRSRWHQSIEFALTTMTSISLLEKFYFKGDWPHASIRCKGIFIGSELITVGDAVRVLPDHSSNLRNCTDILVVESIRLQLENIKPEHVTPESPSLASRCCILLAGKAFTIDGQRGYSAENSKAVAITAEEAKTIFRPVGTNQYGPLYWLHAEHKRLEISHDQVLGRLYEASAVSLWTGGLQRKPLSGAKAEKPRLDFDHSGVIQARLYATQTDERLEEAESGEVLWFWADTRAEALDLQTMNGHEVGRYDRVRDRDTLEMWRQQLRILNGVQASLDSIASKFTNFASLDAFGRKRGRPAGSKIINGKLYKPGDPGYESIVGGNDVEATVHLTPSKHKGSQLAGAALVSTDEDEDNEDELQFEDAKETLAPSIERDQMRSSPASFRSALPAPAQRQPKTKMEIMASAGQYTSSEEDEDWSVLPPARGGTEESEGGDYRPPA